MGGRCGSHGCGRNAGSGGMIGCSGRKVQMAHLTVCSKPGNYGRCCQN